MGLGEKLQQRSRGFTLIEMSLVLVVIGLVIGGILVGQDLIGAAAVRAQIAQLEKYQTAVNTFRAKYNDRLPGDIPEPDASNFGFYPRTWQGVAGVGDGNGLIQGWAGNGGAIGTGELAMFWTDLSGAGLVNGTFNAFTGMGTFVTALPTQLSSYFPPAKIPGNYIFVWSGGLFVPGNPGCSGNACLANGANNYFELQPLMGLNNGAPTGNIDSIPPGWMTPAAPYALSVAQAYAIDTKMDDGLPESGKVLAILETGAHWANPYSYNAGSTSPLTGDPHTCQDNNNGASPWHYSLQVNSGLGQNCALSFQFQ